MVSPLALLVVQLSFQAPHELGLDYSTVTPLNYSKIQMSGTYDRYWGGPFGCWAISEDAAHIFWTKTGVSQLSNNVFFTSLVTEMRVKGNPIAMLTWHFNKLFADGRVPKTTLAGEAWVGKLLGAYGSTLMIVHTTNAMKWRQETEERSGVSVIEADPRRKPLLKAPIFSCSAGKPIIAAVADRSSSSRIALGTLNGTPIRSKSTPIQTTYPVSIQTVHLPEKPGERSRVAHITSTRMPGMLPGLLFDSKRQMIVSYDDKGDIIFIDSVSGRLRASCPLPTKSRKLFRPINITWHPNGGVLITLRQSSDPQRNLQLWLLNAKTKQWTYLGPWGVLGASRNGDYQLVASPLDPKQCWLLKLKG